MVAKQKRSRSVKHITVKRGASEISLRPKEFYHIARKICAAKDVSRRTPRGVATKLLQEGKKSFLI
jgi:hypothetical protein